MKTFSCKHCGTEKKWSRSSTNSYCSRDCQNKYEWINKTIPLIKAGKKTSNSQKTLRRYVIERDGEVCAACCVGTEWNGKRLSLHLDHIDGDSDNNFPNNLQLLCPNCHSQTETYGSKGTGNTIKKLTKRNSYLQRYKSTVGLRG